ncbi:hypothetical protein [Acinetobacter pittii]|uniref:hypothetical protein n=1 Tax=Acinetobacter pittii TaxID=48296 RepID=UPI000D0BBC2C|nr:hypothetical protein [Acinetobacter pittii]PSD73950.1 hypothetical protein C7G49_13875 [Acinetobacter pittii]
MTLSEIREQLAVVAERNGRPPYDLCVLKAVQFAVNNGTEHPLKEYLTKPKAAIKSVSTVKGPSAKSGPKRAQATVEEIKALCEWVEDEVGRQAMLAEKAGTAPSVLWRINRTQTCTKALYNRLITVRKEIEKRQKGNPLLKTRNEAMDKGLPYYTGRECEKCKTTTRYVTCNKCVHCMAEANKRKKEMAA